MQVQEPFEAVCQQKKHELLNKKIQLQAAEDDDDEYLVANQIHI